MFKRFYRSLIVIAPLLLSLFYYYRSLIIIAHLFALNLCINEIIGRGKYHVSTP
jgi:hypothetical protein